MRRMVFTVMVIRNTPLTQYALTLSGFSGTHWIVPRYLRCSCTPKVLERRAAELNKILYERGKLLHI